jgi:anthranilate phosphoribosyltransferase
MTYNEALETFDTLFSNKMSNIDMKNLLIDLHKKGESADEIAAASKIMKEHSIKLDVPKEIQDKLIDNCGTGGDKSGSFNISTTVSFVLAGSGLYVAKHGNRSITSQSGSADVLEALGVRLDLPPEKQITLLQESGFTFIFAINHHPAMKFIMPIRKSLDHRTIFNLLGPLTNPANVKKQLIGVFDSSFIQKMAYSLQINQATSAMVVSSLDGMDEISISAPTNFALLKDNNISIGEINPNHFGMKLSSLEAIKGGDKDYNAQLMNNILSGKIDDSRRDIVLLNAGAGLMVDGIARDMKEGIEIAKDSLLSGKALNALKQTIEISQKL